MKKITAYDIHKNLHINKRIEIEQYLDLLSSHFDNLISNYLAGTFYKKGFKKVDISKSFLENELFKKYKNTTETSVEVRTENIEISNKIKVLIGINYTYIEELASLTIRPLQITEEFYDSISHDINVIRIG